MYDLVMVMPVYNEEACIVNVIESWYFILFKLKIKFLILLLNDGSQDNTQEILASLTHHREYLKVINKENSGHGPTVLMGYHEAVKIAKWVFQCDSDNEFKPENFPEFWIKRSDYVALFGIRKERDPSLNRRFISRISYFVVNLLFGKGVIDVNIPYRLIRSDILKPIIQQIPLKTFAPNVLISSALVKSKIPVCNIAVAYQYRQTGSASLIKWRLWKSAIISFWQTLNFYFNLRGSVKNAYRQ